MAFRSVSSIRVPFHDVDIMQVVWHGHYYKYFEIARTNLMKSLGMDWPVLRELGYAMPVVDAGSRYRRPLEYDQSVVVHAEIRDYTLPALEVFYRVTNPDESTLYATGSTRQIYLEVSTMETLFQVPDEIAKRFREAEVRV